MIYISEWLPNPVGSDTHQANPINPGEFIELYNGGSTYASLEGWTINTEKGRPFRLDGFGISPGNYLLLTRDQTKLTLRNTDGGLFLYDPSGNLIDAAEFKGSAPEGKSYSRIDFHGASYADTTVGVFASAPRKFTFEIPTPDGENNVPAVSFISQNYQAGAHLNPGLTISGFSGIMLVTAAMVAVSGIYILRRNEDIFDSFFRRDH